MLFTRLTAGRTPLLANVLFMNMCASVRRLAVKQMDKALAFLIGLG
jgi:hypothetical protein